MYFKISNSVFIIEKTEHNKQKKDGYEAWRMTGKDKRGIAALEINALRRCCGILRRDRIRNEVIERQIKISETVEEEILKRKIIWYGRVRRIEKSRILRMAMHKSRFVKR